MPEPQHQCAFPGRGVTGWHLVLPPSRTRSISEIRRHASPVGAGRFPHQDADIILIGMLLNNFVQNH